MVEDKDGLTLIAMPIDVGIKKTNICKMRAFSKRSKNDRPSI
jgi:hypothetical protein